MQAADRADRPGRGGGGETAVAQRGQVPADVGRPHVGEFHDPGGGELRGVTVEVTPVRRERVAGQATFHAEMVQVRLYRPFECQRSTSVSGVTGMPCASATGP